MIPSLLLEEPPARTSAKEPWVSDGVQSGCRGCKAAGEAGEGRSAASLPPQAAWRFPFPEASWNFSFHGSPTLRHAIAQMCTEASCVPCTGLVVEVTKMLPLEALGVSARPPHPQGLCTSGPVRQSSSGLRARWEGARPMAALRPLFLWGSETGADDSV